MNWYTPRTVWFVWVFLMAFSPSRVSAASITETKAAIGEGCVASGHNSTAMGYVTTASGNNSTAMGQITSASGGSSTAMGYGTTASGGSSTAMGYYTTASGGSSTAMGFITEAAGDSSFAGGRYMQLQNTADYTFVWGNSTTVQPISAPNAFLIFPVGTSGKVGLGTKSPHHLLDLGATLGKKLAVYQNTTGDDFYGFGISSGTLEIYAGEAVSGSPKMVVKNTSGNVGIGTTSPDYRLEVAGDAAKTLGGTTWINSSDARLKDITGEYDAGLKEILMLKPVTFYYKADNQRDLPTDEENIGFVAQEVQEVFPEAVSEGPDGYLDFNMHPVNVAVVNAIKELKAENDMLKAENAMLKKDIERIKEVLGI